MVEITEKPKSKKNKILPKFYGKEKILDDIKKQQIPATELQKAMLALNTMRNMYSKLLSRGISDTIDKTNFFNDEDCRAIVGVVRIIEKKLNPILKK